MLFADFRLKPMQGLYGFATQTQINADNVNSILLVESVAV
jgi:hypothetical protein